MNDWRSLRATFSVVSFVLAWNKADVVVLNTTFGLRLGILGRTFQSDGLSIGKMVGRMGGRTINRACRIVCPPSI